MKKQKMVHNKNRNLAKLQKKNSEICDKNKSIKNNHKSYNKMIVYKKKVYKILLYIYTMKEIVVNIFEK